MTQSVLTAGNTALEASPETESRQILADAYLICDVNFRITECNELAAQLTGYHQSELLSSDLFQLFPDAANNTSVIHKHLLQHSDSSVFEQELHHKSGQILMTEVKVSAISENQHLFIIRDITERKQSEQSIRESEELFRSVTSSTSTAIFIYCQDKFVFVNTATEIITGYSREELLSMNYWEVVHPSHQKLVKDRGRARQQHLENIPGRYELKLLTKTGEERWIDFNARPMMWMYKKAAIASAYDITERKRMEEQLITSEKKCVPFLMQYLIFL